MGAVQQRNIGQPNWIFSVIILGKIKRNLDSLTFMYISILNKFYYFGEKSEILNELSREMKE